MTNQPEDIFRQAISERVEKADDPRPFGALNSATSELDRKKNIHKQRWFNMNLRDNQRGLLVGAMACIAIVFVGVLVAVGRANDTNEIQYATESTLTTTNPALNSTEQSGRAGSDSISVEMVCQDGGTSSVEVPGTDEGQIDDVVNTIDGCEGRGGLASVRFVGCSNDPHEVEIEADENGGLDDFDSLDYCENDRAEEPSSNTTRPPFVTRPATVSATTVVASDPIPVDFVCENGPPGSVDVDVDSEGEIDDFINSIDLCEFSGGLVSLSFEASCPGRTQTVQVFANQPEGVPDIDSIETCE